MNIYRLLSTLFNSVNLQQMNMRQAYPLTPKSFLCCLCPFMQAQPQRQLSPLYFHNINIILSKYSIMLSSFHISNCELWILNRLPYEYMTNSKESATITMKSYISYQKYGQPTEDNLKNVLNAIMKETIEILQIHLRQATYNLLVFCNKYFYTFYKNFTFVYPRPSLCNELYENMLVSLYSNITFISPVY